MYVISRCLAGVPCRYDGKSKGVPEIMELAEKEEVLLVCPEVLGGLPTPRVPSEIREGRVVNKEGEDVTGAFVRGAERAMALCREKDCGAAILKADSPSCGIGRVHNGLFDGGYAPLNGIFADMVLKAGIPAMTEKEYLERIRKTGRETEDGAGPGEEEKRKEPEIRVIRAETLSHRAGAFYVRIQGMARAHHISLEEEFDEHDGEGTRYILITDEGFPIATCRFYDLEEGAAMIGRVVVLPEYRGRGLGRTVVLEAEKWLSDLGFEKAVVESRDAAVEFYKKLGYHVTDGTLLKGPTFDCIRMEKTLAE